MAADEFDAPFGDRDREALAAFGRLAAVIPFGDDTGPLTGRSRRRLRPEPSGIVRQQLTIMTICEGNHSGLPIERRGSFHG